MPTADYDASLEFLASHASETNQARQMLRFETIKSLVGKQQSKLMLIASLDIQAREF